MLQPISQLSLTMEQESSRLVLLVRTRPRLSSLPCKSTPHFSRSSAGNKDNPFSLLFSLSSFLFLFLFFLHSVWRLLLVLSLTRRCFIIITPPRSLSVSSALPLSVAASIYSTQSDRRLWFSVYCRDIGVCVALSLSLYINRLQDCFSSLCLQIPDVLLLYLRRSRARGREMQSMHSAAKTG